MRQGHEDAPETGLGPRRGAYGLALRGLDRAGELLVPAPASWPVLDVLAQQGSETPAADVITERRAELGLAAGGRIHVEREPLRAVFETPAPLADGELVHPYLGSAAVVAAFWFGWESFHAGAVVVEGGAWAVLGEREAGKSSLLAWLALTGVDVAADDVLVVDGATVFAGPRAVDLRREPAARFGAGEYLGRVGARERWRLQLGPVAPELRLRGWIFLVWGERVEARRLAGGSRVLELARQRAI
ncbi:MAG TPA: hypothetical protein VHF23_03090, partial [Gaiellaceae bacterium]|nr:hypothetical protein [Gaiellaceae bacterium]